MAEATERELRNDAGRVLDRVMAGEHVTITRHGEPVAELVPLNRRPLSTAAVLERFRKLPAIDPATFRADIDAIIDQSL